MDMEANKTERERIDSIVGRRTNFSQSLGIRIVSADPDRLVAEVDVTETMANRNGTMHGGAMMAIADDLGGLATFVAIAEGQGTTTVESKTNFFRPVAIGDRVMAEATPLHKGRKTMVWQTRIVRGDGKLAAIVTQTQLIMSGNSRKSGFTLAAGRPDSFGGENGR